MQKNRTLQFTSKIEVRESPIEGWGVFAKEDILKGEVLEESPFILFPSYTILGKEIYEVLNAQKILDYKEKYAHNLSKNLGFKDPDDYFFKWRPKHQISGEELFYRVLPLGFGPIYNTSNSSNNAEWKIQDNIFAFFATRDIKKDEEICTFYGYFLDEEGTKFECDEVYNIGFDYFDNQVGFKSIRFSSLDSFQAAKNDPFLTQIMLLFKSTESAVRISKIVALSATGNQEAEINIPNNVSLKNLFNKLKECKKSSFPQIKFVFEYIDKQDSLTKETQIIWKR